MLLVEHVQKLEIRLDDAADRRAKLGSLLVDPVHIGTFDRDLLTDLLACSHDHGLDHVVDSGQYHASLNAVHVVPLPAHDWR